jgi:hypothetical protein
MLSAVDSFSFVGVAFAPIQRVNPARGKAMKDDLENWLDSARYDPGTAEQPAGAGRCPAVFQKMHRDFSRERAESVPSRTKETFSWIWKHIR